MFLKMYSRNLQVQFTSSIYWFNVADLSGLLSIMLRPVQHPILEQPHSLFLFGGQRNFKDPFFPISEMLINFSKEFHEKILFFFKRDLNFKEKTMYNLSFVKKIEFMAITSLLIFQLVFPFRHYFYPGELFWHEQGYRFSWRVMLMEKKGYTQFKIVDSLSKSSFYVKNEDFLTNYQEKQMSFQPDFILEFAHYLEEQYSQKGIENIQVFADSHVALNERRNQRFIDPNKNLLEFNRGFKNKSWILPFNDEIKGF